MAHETKNTSGNRTIGAFGEDAVVEFIRERGLTILDRNWRIREGEIDIVAKHAVGTVVFIEVKTRTSVAFGHPLEAINSDKARRLQRLALAWLATHQALGCDYRIDCAAVLISAGGKYTVEYRESVL